MKFQTFLKMSTILCVIIFIGTATFGNTNPLPALFLPAYQYKFQPVIEGIEVTHDFIVQNNGKAPLLIEKVKTG